MNGPVIVSGDLVEVADVPEGSSTVGAIAAGATAVAIANVDDFGEDGICLLQTGFDADGAPTYQSHTFELADPYADLDDVALEMVVDDDAGPGTLSVSPAVTAAMEDGFKVLACNAQGKPETKRVADVQIYDDDPELVSVDVPTGLYGFFEVGHYQAGTVIELESVGLGYRLLRQPFEEPAMDAGVLDPATLQPAGITPLELHEAAQEAIEDDIAAANAEAGSGGSTIAAAIAKRVADFNASLAAKPGYTKSTALPGVTANNPGHVWERFDTTTSPHKLIGRWVGLGGTSWQMVALDASFLPQIDIGTGTFGSLAGGRLLANTIGVRQLVVTNFDNLIADPRFSLPLGDTSGWSNGGASASDIFIQSGLAQDGGGPALVVTPAAGSRYLTNASTQMWDVEPGQAFRVVFSGRSGTGQPAQAIGACNLSIRFFATDGTFTDVTLPFGSFPGWTSAWSLREGIIKVPTNKQYHRAYAFLRFEGVRTASMVVERVSVTRAADASLIVDGDVQARHFNGDTFTGVVMTAPLIQTTAPANRGLKLTTAGLIGYDSRPTVNGSTNPDLGLARLVVDPNSALLSMIGGSIQGATFTGGLFRTAPDGRRVELSSSSSTDDLRFYSGSGLETAPGTLGARSNMVEEVDFFGNPTGQTIATALQRMAVAVTSSHSSAYAYLDLESRGQAVLRASDRIRFSTPLATVYGALSVKDGIDSQSLADGGIRNLNSGTKYLRAGQNGNVFAHTAAPSSRAIKHDITPVTDEALSLAMGLPVFRGFYNDDPTTPRYFLTVEDTVEHGGHEFLGYDDLKTRTKPGGVHYDDLAAIGLAISQRQQTLIDALTERVAALEGA